MRNLLQELDNLAKLRKESILSAEDSPILSGRVFYVSERGDDANDGLSEQTPVKSLDRVSNLPLSKGDSVLFRRGELFRGTVRVRAGVRYGAYGKGEKPKLYGWDYSLADCLLWSPVDGTQNIWRLNKPILDVGTLVFDGGRACAYKHIPSYKNGKFVCRNKPEQPFVIAEQLVNDLQLFWQFDEITTCEPSRGEDFPIPKVDENSYGTLYLRCDGGNPGAVFSEIEALPRRNLFCVADEEGVTIENLCMKYVGAHAVSAWGDCVKSLTVTGCEIGWIGGSIQHYFGTDPNYPEGGRGTVTRYGNGVEVYGGCDGYTVSNCYIYEVYDAAITHQVTTDGRHYEMKNVRYRDNLIENCVYGVEYFLDMTKGDQTSFMENVAVEDNIIRNGGHGWGQQRHNTNTPALVKGWNYTNRARNFVIRNNLFDRSKYRLLHLVCGEEASLPTLYGNTYVQTLDGMLGEYGENKTVQPPVYPFDQNAEQTIKEIFGDTAAKTYSV